MLGESRGARVMRRAIPAHLGEFDLFIPQVKTEIKNSTVVLESESLPGISLLEAIYQPERRERAVQVGALTFQALYQSQANWLAGRFLGMIY